jgi:hypothetical protein
LELIANIQPTGFIICLEGKYNPLGFNKEKHTLAGMYTALLSSLKIVHGVQDTRERLGVTDINKTTRTA